MKNIKKILIAAVFISQFAVVPFVYAEGIDGAKGDLSQKWHEKMEQKMQEMYAQLGLTEEQKTQLESNKQKSMNDMKALYEKKKDFKDQLNQELMKPELNMAQIGQIQTQIKAVQAETADHRLNSILEVRKILTAEQFSKFISMMDKHKDKHFGPSEGKE